MKRLVKSLALALVILTVSVLFVGWQNPATTHTLHIPIEAPADFTWNQFQNFNNNKRWIEGYQTMEVVSGMPGQPGSECRMFLNLDGTDFEITQRLESITPGKRIHLTTHSSFGEGTMILEILDRGDHCELQVFSRMVGGDALSCAFNKAMHQRMRNREQLNYTNFKNLVELKFDVLLQ